VSSIKKTAVIGAGAMGHGIAQAFAQSGFQVALQDVAADVLEKAKGHVETNLTLLAEYGMVKSEEIGEILERITPVSKQKVLRAVEASCPEDTLLATTTSVIQVGDIAEGIQKPERFIGTHWMNPPFVLPLVEIVRGPKTSESVISSVQTFLEDECGKRTVVCGDTPGFLVNRMAAAVLVEAAKMVEDGIASFEDIDRAWKEHMGYVFLQFGPFGNIDHIGLDVIGLAANYLAFVLEDESFRPPPWLQEKVDSGDLGTKTGKGIYDYGGRSPEELRVERIRKLLEILQVRGSRFNPPVWRPRPD